MCNTELHKGRLQGQFSQNIDSWDPIEECKWGVDEDVSSQGRMCMWHICKYSKKRSTLNIARLISNNSREPSFSRTKPLCDCYCFPVKNSLNVCYMPGSTHITYIFFFHSL